MKLYYSNITPFIEKGNYIPKSEECLLSKSGKASCYAKHERKDAEGRVDRDERGAEAGRAFVADQQEKEAEESDCVLESLRKI